MPASLRPLAVLSAALVLVGGLALGFGGWTALFKSFPVGLALFGVGWFLARTGVELFRLIEEAKEESEWL
ncbi:MAG TPA: hypothetical protein VF377_06830 [Acidimicrobiia bacterium]